MTIEQLTKGIEFFRAKGATNVAMPDDGSCEIHFIVVEGSSWEDQHLIGYIEKDGDVWEHVKKVGYQKVII